MRKINCMLVLVYFDIFSCVRMVFLVSFNCTSLHYLKSIFILLEVHLDLILSFNLMSFKNSFNSISAN